MERKKPHVNRYRTGDGVTMGALMTSVIGIDPGYKGAAAFISAERHLDYIRFSLTDRAGETSWYHATWFLNGAKPQVTIEQVHGRPGDTPMTAFQFGRSLGKTEDRLESAGFDELEHVAPQTWQREFGLANKMKYSERQKKQQIVAQELFPGVKVTQDMAAAILIAEYAWRKLNGKLTERNTVHDGVKRGAGITGISRRNKN